MHHGRLLDLLALAYPNAEIDVLAFPTGAAIVEVRFEQGAVLIEDRVAEGGVLTVFRQEAHGHVAPTFATEEEVTAHLDIVMTSRRSPG